MILRALATVIAPLAAVLAVASVGGPALALVRAYVGRDRMLPPDAIAGLGPVLVAFVVAVLTAGLMPDLHGVEAIAGAALGASVCLTLLVIQLVVRGLREARKQFHVTGGAARRGGLPLAVKSIELSQVDASTGPGSGYVTYGIRLTLADGEVVHNRYLDKDTWERDLAGIEVPGSYRDQAAR